MSEWKKVLAEDYCDSVRDGTHDTPKRVENGFKLVTGKHIKGGIIDHSSAYFISEDDYNAINVRSKVHQWDVLMSMIGTVGEVAIVKTIPDYAIKNIALFKCEGNEIKAKWLYYFLSSPITQGALHGNLKGSSQQFLSLKQIRNLPISVPNEEVMLRIVKVLSRYDSLIENYQKQIKLLEEAAQRLYKEWFIDLHFPGHENTNIVDGVPEGWEKKSVTDVLEIKYGKDHKLLKDGTIPVYGTGGVMRYVEKNLYTGESVLIPRKGSLNNILLVNGTFWTIDTMFYSIQKEDNVAKIVYFFLKGVDMYSFNIGAAVPSMTVNILSGMKLLIPKCNTRKEFENIVSTFYNRIQSLQSQLCLLTEARDRLLPKLMSGAIEV